MPLHGQHLIGGDRSGQGPTFRAIDPGTSRELEPPVYEATPGEADRALSAAAEAFPAFRAATPEQRANLLEAIATEIEALGDPLLERVNAETALGLPRLNAERGRTAGQLRMFAALAREGSWVDARIDRANPDRRPLPKPDLRRMRIPIGPIVSFSASNFPLAISVAGNDLASAFAAGCPIVVKNHPNHPGTAELVAGAVYRAIKAAGLPAGIFSMLNGRGHEIGLALVRHPLTKAVAFTGSLRGGRALFDAASVRPEPIPVFAEMGSINPVFILPGAIAERGGQIASELRTSVTMGVGQFCTNPGLVVGLRGEETTQFIATAGKLMAEAAPGTMLYGGIRDAYAAGVAKQSATPGVSVAGRSSAPVDDAKMQAAAALLSADAAAFLANDALAEEVFGPSTLVVTADSKEQLLQVARQLEGHLTATLHGTPADLEEYRDLIAILEQKVGRLLFNGFPTGVEVAPAQHHGGPYPATTDARTTSVGTAAIERFVRPISYQNFPQAALPPELQDANPRNIWRLVDGEWTRGPIVESRT